MFLRSAYFIYLARHIDWVVFYCFSILRRKYALLDGTLRIIEFFIWKTRVHHHSSMSSERNGKKNETARYFRGIRTRVVGRRGRFDGVEGRRYFRIYDRVAVFCFSAGTFFRRRERGRRWNIQEHGPLNRRQNKNGVNIHARGGGGDKKTDIIHTVSPDGEQNATVWFTATTRRNAKRTRTSARNRILKPRGPVDDDVCHQSPVELSAEYHDFLCVNKN